MWTAPLTELILASASPRRLELLQQIQVPVRQLVVATTGEDEPRLANETVIDYVTRTAQEKNLRTQKYLAQTSTAQSHLPPILSADTTVAIGQQILGKPTDAADAKRILTTLAGRTHDVYSAVVLHADHSTYQTLSHTEVEIDVSILEAIDDYIASAEPFGKAGAYAIQGIAAAYVRSVRGSYTAVVGLPLFETTQLLRDAGLYR